MAVQFNKLPSSYGDLIRQDVLHDPIARLSRVELLTIQFAKCINYFKFDTTPEWGGQSHESLQGPTSIEAGYQRFLADVDGHGNDSQPKWLHKKYAAVPWGPDNHCLRADPAIELGYPYEPYLTVNGAILTLNQASRILSIKLMDLVKLKCTLLEDRKIVEHAVMQMLTPRPLWPRIQLKPGGKGRSYRFGSTEEN